MKPAHKSNAGQIVNRSEKMQKLSDYIKQVEVEEKAVDAFDHWLDEPYYEDNLSRREWWSETEISAARQAWKAAKK